MTAHHPTYPCIRCGGDVTEPRRACLDCWATDRTLLRAWAGEKETT